MRDKLIALIAKAKRSMWGKSGLSCELARNSYLAEYLIANGVRLECSLEKKQATSDESKRTNADRIRAMTDEELGIFLGEWADKPWAWKRDGEGECLAWLQEPAKEESKKC